MRRMKLRTAVAIAVAAICSVVVCGCESYAANSSFPSTKTASDIVYRMNYHTINSCYTAKVGWAKNWYKGTTRYSHDYVDLSDESIAAVTYQMPGEIEYSQRRENLLDPIYHFSWRRIVPNEGAYTQMYFPNGLTPAIDDSSDCASFYYGDDYGKDGAGGDGWTDTIFDRLGKTDLTFENGDTAAKMEAYMQGMGYTKTLKEGSDEADGTKCMSITYTPVRNGLGDNYTGPNGALPEETTGAICFEVKDGKINSYAPVAEDDTIPELSTKYLRFARMGQPEFGATATDNQSYEMFLRIRHDNTVDGEDSISIGQEVARCLDYEDDYGYPGTSPEIRSPYGWCKFTTQVFTEDDDYGTIYYFNESWDTFVSEMRGLVDRLGNAFSSGTYHRYYALGCVGYTGSTCTGGRYVIYITNAKLNVWDAAGNESIVWVLKDSDRNINTVNKAANFIGGTSLDALKISPSQEALLYQYYIITRAKGVVKCDLSEGEVQSQFKPIKWFNSAEARSDCYLTGWTEGLKYNVPNMDKISWSQTDIGGLVNLLNAVDISSISDLYKDDVSTVVSSLTDGNEEGPGGGDGDTTVEANCYTNAGSLGWIVCPLITTGAEMIQKTYEGMVVPFLRMDPRLFSNDEHNGTYIAWNVFRNLANIAFVILFLVVIFSQLTGFGIDNYGIKKILPKLIIAAILINVSYILCQLAVDIANIVGSGIGELFVRIGNQVMSSPPNYCTGDSGASCVAATAGTAGGAGGFIALIAVVAGITTVAVLAIGPQIIIPVLLAILAFVIAIFFLFVVLGIRQAMAVLLVVISPCAFLCYMLPNTKKLFDKWLGSLKGLLVAYPICSAMVYGGDMAAKILLTSYRETPKDLATLTPVLAAGIIAVAPIFLIPGIIRKSMGAIGSIATRIQGRASGRARGRAEGALRRTALNNPDKGAITGRIMRRQRYKQQQREDDVKALQSEYNAKMGKRELYGRKGNNKRSFGRDTLAAKAAAGTLSTEEKRRYNRALSAVNAESTSDIDTYTSSYKSMGGDDAIISSVQESFNNNSLTADQFAAAVQAIHDEDKVASLLSISKGSGPSAQNVLSKFKGGSNQSAINDRQKIADALTSRKNNVVAQSAGKLINTNKKESAPGAGDAVNGYDFNDMMNIPAGGSAADSLLGKKIQAAGAGVMASQDKDVFRIAGVGNMFSTEQLAAGVGAGLTGAAGGNFSEMLYNSGRGNEVLDSMSVEQMAKVSSQGYDYKGATAANPTISIMQALGGDMDETVAAGRIKSNTNAANLIDSLSSTANSQTRASMDASTMAHLGVQNGSEVIDTAQYTDHTGAGDFTIIRKSDGKYYKIDHTTSATGATTVTESEIDIKNYKRK